MYGLLSETGHLSTRHLSILHLDVQHLSMRRLRVRHLSFQHLSLQYLSMQFLNMRCLNVRGLLSVEHIYLWQLGVWHLSMGTFTYLLTYLRMHTLQINWQEPPGTDGRRRNREEEVEEEPAVLLHDLQGNARRSTEQHLLHLDGPPADDHGPRRSEFQQIQR